MVVILTLNYAPLFRDANKCFEPSEKKKGKNSVLYVLRDYCAPPEYHVTVTRHEIGFIGMQRPLRYIVRRTGAWKVGIDKFGGLLVMK